MKNGIRMALRTLVLCGLFVGVAGALYFTLRVFLRVEDQAAHRRFDPIVASYRAMVRRDAAWLSANVGRSFSIADTNLGVEARIVGSQHTCTLEGPGTVRLIGVAASSEETFFHFTSEAPGSEKNKECSDADFVIEQQMPTDAEAFGSCDEGSWFWSTADTCRETPRNPFVAWLTKSIDETKALRAEKTVVDGLVTQQSPEGATIKQTSTTSKATHRSSR